jgi:hypothetical protein
VSPGVYYVVCSMAFIFHTRTYGNQFLSTGYKVLRLYPDLLPRLLSWTKGEGLHSRENSPIFWNDDAQRAVSKMSFAEHPEFNLRLNNIQAAIRNVCDLGVHILSINNNNLKKIYSENNNIGSTIGSEYQFYLAKENKNDVPHGIYLTLFVSYCHFNLFGTIDFNQLIACSE